MIGPARLHPARSLTGAGVWRRRLYERFAHTYGPWRAVVPAVVDRLLAATPGGSPAGPSGWTKRSSPPSRTATDGGFRPDSTFVRWPGWPAYDG